MIKYKMISKAPENIIFTLLIIEVFANLNLFFNAGSHPLHIVYRTQFSINNPMPSSFPHFCVVTGVISSFTTILEHVYLVYFNIFVIFNVKRSIKESNQSNT